MDVYGRASATTDTHVTSPQYNYESVRLGTFSNWPVTFLNPKVMAAAGFYYTHREDIVRCAFCGIDVGQWVSGDDPLADHERWAPDCVFLERPNDVGNVPLDDDPTLNSASQEDTTLEMQKMGIFKKTPPRFLRYVALEARLNSFDAWPVSIPVKGEELSQAGFYYTGKGDCTICFHCGLSLRHWLSQDDPWLEHAKYSPECTFLLLHKGQLYVDAVDGFQITIHQRNQSEESITPHTLSPSCGATEADSRNLENAHSCKICYASDLELAVLPCAHLVSCIDCAFRLDVCIICRQAITAMIRIYM